MNNVSYLCHFHEVKILQDEKRTLSMIENRSSLANAMRHKDILQSETGILSCAWKKLPWSPNVCFSWFVWFAANKNHISLTRLHSFGYSPFVFQQALMNANLCRLTDTFAFLKLNVLYLLLSGKGHRRVFPWQRSEDFSSSSLNLRTLANNNLSRTELEKENVEMR